MADAVDVLRLAFFTATVVLTLLMMLKLGSTSRMTMIDLPMNWVYGICLVGFSAMTFRSVRSCGIHSRRGYSVLERPATEIGDR